MPALELFFRTAACTELFLVAGFLLIKRGQIPAVLFFLGLSS